MQNSKRPTMKDVARSLGLSQPTVSLILSGNGERYSAETRARVVEAARQLNYQPNIVARSLQAQKSFLMGVLLSSVNYDILAEVSRGIQDVAADHRYAPIVFTHDNREEEARCLERCLERGVDGLIINAAVDADGNVNSDDYARLARLKLPVIELFGHFIPEMPNVVIDTYQNGRNAVQLLYDRGHRKVAVYTVDVASHPPGHPTGFYWAVLEKRRGFREMAEQLGVEAVTVTHPLPPTDNRPGARFQVAFDSAEQLFRHPLQPTGIICLSEESMHALSMYAAVHPEHIRPGLTVITSGESAPWHRFIGKTITMPYPLYQIGKHAAELLLARMNGSEAHRIALASVVESENLHVR